MAAVAATVAVPGTWEVNVAVATPLDVPLVTVTLPKLPRLVSKSTDVSSATLLSYWSFTVAVSVELSPTVRVIGWATRVSV